MSLSGYIKSKLNNSDQYLRLRYNEKVLAFWKMFRRDAAKTLEQQDIFYKSLLQLLKRSDSVIFDIGANEGFVTQTLSKLAGKIVAIEPDPLNIRILQNRFSSNSKVIIVGKAVSDKTGTETLYIEQNGSALHTLNNRWKSLLESGEHVLKTSFDKSLLVETTTLSELIEKFGSPSFIKIDTEGYERKALSGLTSPVPQIIFEAVLPHFLDETIMSIDHLCGIDRNAVFNYSTNYDLVLPEFLTAIEFKHILQQIGNKSIDIVCRMGNYNNYYK
jgi:FkbM family methyltransferase